ncbi:amino acid ABC transporter permease [Acuticoccus kandeliae]|uniref:amino acid ABC transporter permease n=1 Tax=Acuticoccus kandeliae TaxID=2073160 RepID=UPI000D3E276C|nr:amino acid ABC transporter permease [Acuticoccus kandeliae]
MLDQLNQSLDLTLFWEYRRALLSGFANNILIFAVAGILATVLAFIIGSARLSRIRILRFGALGYTEFFRNTPEYILLVWVYYILPVLLTKLLQTRFDFSPFIAAVLALGVAYSGFLAETVRAGLRSVPSGQVEAALSLGMSRRDITWRIVVPQAVRRMLPEALNQYISLFKATSIVSLIAVEDIMYRVSMINIEEMRPLPLYTGAALVYCLIIITASQLVQRLTNGWRRRGWA